MTSINDVAKAYGNVLDAAGKGVEKSPTLSGPSFGDILKNSVETTIEAQHTSERMSAAAITGNADMTDVLQAVTDAEVTLNTVLAVRDRVINAYQQIMRTPI